MRTLLKLLVPCVLVLAVMIAAVSMEGIAKKNPGQNPASGKTQAQIAAEYGQTLPTAPVETTEAVAAETTPEETVAETTETVPVETEPAETEPVERRYTMTFVGDCTFGTTPSAYNAQLGFVKLVGDDYKYPFANVLSYFENDDFTFFNMEGPLCDEGYPVTKQFCFRGPTEFVNILTENSVEAVTLANNHTRDYGEKGYAATKQVLEEAGVSYVESNSTTVITLEDGTTIGIYSDTYDDAKEKLLVEGIDSLKQQGADVIIYAAHWGVENSYQVSKVQKTMAHAAIDAGANIVYGSHPHVLQPIEEYNGGVIYYSMGNFSFGGNGGPKDMDTAIIQQEVICKSDGTITLGERTVVPCSVSSVLGTNNFQPTPYEENSREYNRVLKKLNGTFK